MQSHEGTLSPRPYPWGLQNQLEYLMHRPSHLEPPSTQNNTCLAAGESFSRSPTYLEHSLTATRGPISTVKLFILPNPVIWTQNSQIQAGLTPTASSKTHNSYIQHCGTPNKTSKLYKWKSFHARLMKFTLAVVRMRKVILFSFSNFGTKTRHSLGNWIVIRVSYAPLR